MSSDHNQEMNRLKDDMQELREQLLVSERDLAAEGNTAQSLHARIEALAHSNKDLTNQICSVQQRDGAKTGELSSLQVNFASLQEKDSSNQERMVTLREEVTQLKTLL